MNFLIFSHANDREKSARTYIQAASAKATKMPTNIPIVESASEYHLPELRSSGSIIYPVKAQTGTYTSNNGTSRISHIHQDMMSIVQVLLIPFQFLNVNQN